MRSAIVAILGRSKAERALVTRIVCGPEFGAPRRRCCKFSVAAAAAAASLALAAAPVRAGEFSAAAGIFFVVAEDGVDLHVSYRSTASPWQYGLRALHYSEQSEIFGVRTKSTTTMAGPSLNYMFTPESSGSWYLGAMVLYWARKEESLRTGTSDQKSTVAPFFGGGYRGKIGTSGYYNLGMYFSSAELKTQTADSSEESTGADIQLQIGFAF